MSKKKFENDSMMILVYLPNKLQLYCEKMERINQGFETNRQASKISLRHLTLINYVHICMLGRNQNPNHYVSRTTQTQEFQMKRFQLLHI